MVKYLIVLIKRKLRRENRYMDIQEKKEKILKELEKINATIQPEDIKKAKTEELVKYLELNLQIQKKLEILDVITNN